MESRWLSGIDGCKSGWICISKDIDTNEICSKVFPNAKSLIEQLSKSKVIAVDIPIGLSKDGRRICDVEAKKLLGKRHVTVFYVPIRGAVYAGSHKKANSIQRNISKHGLTIQAFCISPKIREFDEILSKQPHLQKRVKEVHPEICFWAWNNSHPMLYRKKSAKGKELRRSLITDWGTSWYSVPNFVNVVEVELVFIWWHEPFQLLKPIQHDVDPERYGFLWFLDYQEPPIGCDVIISTDRGYL